MNKDATVQGVAVDPGFHCPLCQSRGSSAKLDEDRRASVVAVDLMRDPPTIPRLVVAVVVDPVDFHAVWWVPHICHESVHVVPLLADGNASGSIASKRFARLPMAPRHHVDPDLIDLRPAHPVLRCTRFRLGGFDAPARLDRAAPQMPSCYSLCTPAVASTLPPNPVLAYALRRLRHQHSKPLTGQVQFVRSAAPGLSWCILQCSHMPNLSHRLVGG